MDNIRIAHIGGELVVIGGIAFYLHRKATNLEAEVEALKKTNEELISEIGKITKSLNNLGSIVMQFQQSRSHQPLPQPQPQSATAMARTAPSPHASHASHPSHKQKPRIAKPSSSSQVVAAVASPKKTQQRKVTFVADDDDDDFGDHTLNDDELDGALANEFTQISTERQCRGEVCVLNDSDDE